MTTKQAAAIINAAGLIPAINGTSTSNPVNQEMLNFVSKDGMTAYPMLDNVVQGNVVNIGSKFLPSVLERQRVDHQGACRPCRRRCSSCRRTSGATRSRNPVASDPDDRRTPAPATRRRARRSASRPTDLLEPRP